MISDKVRFATSTLRKASIEEIPLKRVQKGAKGNGVTKNVEEMYPARIRECHIGWLFVEGSCRRKQSASKRDR